MRPAPFRALLILLPISLLLSVSPAILAEGQPSTDADIEDVTELTSDPCTVDNTAFQAGERLTYKLYYKWNFVWLAAGQVTFAVYDTGNEYHISVDGRTFSSYEWFYKVR
ncbi:MAG: DUF3108 domain-containing protein, partial [Bacteroidota bacterium]